MYSKRTRVHACIPNGHPREEKRACRTKVRGQVGELNGPRAPRQTDFRARRTRRLPREDLRVEVGEEVHVGVGVCVGPVECKLCALCVLQLLLYYSYLALWMTGPLNWIIFIFIHRKR